MTYTEHRYLSHDGLSLYYRSYGSGENVVVCLPDRGHAPLLDEIEARLAIDDFLDRLPGVG